MPDDDLLGTVQLARRYRVSQQRARQLMREWSESPTGPTPGRFSGRWCVRLDSLEEWERGLSAAGLPLPGERRRGPASGRA